MMSAKAIASALGGRKTSKGWRANCPAHEDRHPSLDIAESAIGRALLICRSGCTQPELIAALRARGLWSASSSSSRPSLVWTDHVPVEAPAVSDCCLASTTCKHWREFNRRYLLAVLRGNLSLAVGELIEKFDRSSRAVTNDALTSEQINALEFGAIVPSGIDPDVAQKAASRVVADAIKERDARVD